MSKLNGKIALITGGTTGLGFATAERFLSEGAEVVITGVDRLSSIPLSTAWVRTSLAFKGTSPT